MKQHTCGAGQLLAPEQSSVVLPVGHCPAAAHDGIIAPRPPMRRQHDWVVALHEVLPHVIAMAAIVPLLLVEPAAPLELVEPLELDPPLEPLEAVAPPPEDPERLASMEPPLDDELTPGAPAPEEPPVAESTSEPPSSTLSSPKGVRPPQKRRSVAAIDARVRMLVIG